MISGTSVSTEALDRPVGLVMHPDDLNVQAVLGGSLVDTSVIEKALALPSACYVPDPREIIAATQALRAYQVELGDTPSAPLTKGVFAASVRVGFVRSAARPAVTSAGPLAA